MKKELSTSLVILTTAVSLAICSVMLYNICKGFIQGSTYFIQF